MEGLPTWAWVAILVVLAAIVAPIKLRIMKKMLAKRDPNVERDED